MGTDINFYTERRDGDRWVTCDEWIGESEDEYRVPYGKHMCEDRNYDLFAILAGVRNGHGFAGVDTGEGFVPIAAPRGVPDDCCAEFRRFVDEGGIEHTPSYCTVAELLAYDWTRETTKRGILDLSEYLRWRPWRDNYGEFPRSWSGGVSGPGIVIREQTEIDAALEGLDPWQVSHRRLDAEVCRRLGVDVPELVATGDLISSQRQHVRCAWRAPYYRCVGSFLTETMPRLWRLGRPEDVRCVFFFDS